MRTYGVLPLRNRVRTFPPYNANFQQHAREVAFFHSSYLMRSDSQSSERMGVNMTCLTTLLLLISSSILAIKSPCGIDYKPLSNGTCALLENNDVLRAMHFLAFPPKSQACDNITTIQDMAVCEDNLSLRHRYYTLYLTPLPYYPLSLIPYTHSNGECNIWSIISSNRCDHYGSLDFEMYWASRGCKVTIYHTHIYTKGNVCSVPSGQMKGIPP